jgi:hypothetical protein
MLAHYCTIGLFEAPAPGRFSLPQGHTYRAECAEKSYASGDKTQQQ